MRREPSRTAHRAPSFPIWWQSLVLAILCLAGGAVASNAQTGANALVVFNSRVPVARQLADQYLQRRQVPPSNLVVIETDPAVEIARGTYERQIEAPIARALAKGNLHDRIVYIVLIKGVPLRIAGTPPPDGTLSSVDSELALLYRRMSGQAVTVNGTIVNPYFLGDRSIQEAVPFSHRSQDIYLVTRLDGFSDTDVSGLIVRGAAPVTRGRIVLDQKATFIDRGGDRWLAATAKRLQASGAGDRVLLDARRSVVTDVDNVLGYYSWGSNDPASKVRAPKLEFVPGALVATFVSSDARTFEEPPPTWTIGSLFAGSPQSLIGDLIRAGATGGAGHVAEPYLEATIRPQVLFPAYLAGFNLAEAYYLAMPYLSWQTVVIGDPLCAPFRQDGVAPSDLDPGIDRETELPVFFSARRLEAVSTTVSGSQAAKAAVQAESRLARGDRAGSQGALEAATAANPDAVALQLALAALYEESGEVDKAMERYQRVLVATPSNLLALNNLAYILARKGQARDALPLAERAYSLSNKDPRVADTLGWIQHLLGSHATATTLLKEAAAGVPDNAEVRFHLAAALGAAGDFQAAKDELDAALRINPQLAERADVAALRARLPGGPRH